VSFINWLGAGEPADRDTTPHSAIGRYSCRASTGGARAGSDDVTEDSQELFVPIVNEDGELTGVMDQMTADFLASADPDPKQATLDEAFEGVTRVRLVGGRHEPCTVEIDGERYEANQMIIDVVLLDVADPASLTELAAALRVVEADEFGHLMTIGLHHLELWVGDQHVHTIELLYGWDTIRWPSVWKGDGPLAEPRRLENWLVRHGITDARDHREEAEQRGAEWLRAEEDWERALPPSLRPLWPNRLGDGPEGMSPADVDAVEALLRAAVPDPIARVRALYEWFGSGKGPWSGYPPYEGAAEQLLLAYPNEVLLAALDASTDNPAAVYGAARLFGGWNFSQTRKADRKRCPEPLQQRMLDAVIRHGNTDNLQRFRSAFDLPHS
jgi:hypothetical protein